LGGYANGFQSTTDQWLQRQQPGHPSQLEAGSGCDAADYDGDGIITEAAYAQHARQWVAAGASVVGGCCGVSPRHIRALQELRGEE
jgi:S-methylmethionine-dependent homocysteine/selenocysteine methylase